MNLAIKFVLASGAILACTLMVKAQAETPASGGDATGAYGSISFTIGQVNQLYQSGSIYMINQGVQQPYETTLTSNKDPQSSPFDCMLYPNPVSHELVLSLTGKDDMVMHEELLISLYDARGKKLFDMRPMHPVTRLHVQDLASGIYFLHVYDNETGNRIFKIVKI